VRSQQTGPERQSVRFPLVVLLHLPGSHMRFAGSVGANAKHAQSFHFENWQVLGMNGFGSRRRIAKGKCHDRTLSHALPLPDLVTAIIGMPKSARLA
jgi:hypothetical protein